MLWNLGDPLGLLIDELQSVLGEDRIHINREEADYIVRSQYRTFRSKAAMMSSAGTHVVDGNSPDKGGVSPSPCPANITNVQLSLSQPIQGRNYHDASFWPALLVLVALLAYFLQRMPPKPFIGRAPGRWPFAFHCDGGADKIYTRNIRRPL